MKGAEAVLRKISFHEKTAIVKKRIEKKYRNSELDMRLRRERTRSEARLLDKARRAMIPCPNVLDVSEFEIILDFDKGEHPKMTPKECEFAGKLLAKLHEADIIHGDYTPVNLIKTKKGIHVIDFGLGYISQDIEDRAIDVFTMLRMIRHKKEFLKGYSIYSKATSVLKREEDVQKRVRYAN